MCSLVTSYLHKQPPWQWHQVLSEVEPWSCTHHSSNHRHCLQTDSSTGSQEWDWCENGRCRGMKESVYSSCGTCVYTFLTHLRWLGGACLGLYNHNQWLGCHTYHWHCTCWRWPVYCVSIVQGYCPIWQPACQHWETPTVSWKEMRPYQLNTRQKIVSEIILKV